MKNKLLNFINKPAMAYTTSSNLDSLLQPWQITGLTDGEGGFYCSILKTGSGITGFRVKLEFKVVQKSHSENVLVNLQKYFSCGSVVIDNRKTDTKKYHVSSISDILNIIIPHFDAYPCLTSKFLNFDNWKTIALLLKNKEHLTVEGLKKITLAPATNFCVLLPVSFLFLLL
jgi:LAGLIDADG endonuclease